MTGSSGPGALMKGVGMANTQMKTASSTTKPCRMERVTMATNSSSGRMNTENGFSSRKVCWRVSANEAPDKGSVTSVATARETYSTTNNSNNLAVSNSPRGTGRQSQSWTWLTGGSVWITEKMVTMAASSSTEERNISHRGTISSRMST